MKWENVVEWENVVDWVICGMGNVTECEILENVTSNGM